LIVPALLDNVVKKLLANVVGDGNAPMIRLSTLQVPASANKPVDDHVVGGPPGKARNKLNVSLVGVVAPAGAAANASEASVAAAARTTFRFRRCLL